MPEPRRKTSPTYSLLRRLAFLVFTATFAGSHAHAADPPTVMIILDGSGSMWAKLGSERHPKLVLVRAALRATLPKFNGSARLGLASYGHRRSGDCTDVETVVRPNSLQAERVLAAIDRLNPKGRGPIGKSLEETARELGSSTGVQSIILIHDDLDNCQRDVCAIAKDIKEASPRTPIHVISVGMEEAEVEHMSCVARTTGGKQFDVHSGTELTQALEIALSTAISDKPELIAGPKPVERKPQAQTAKPGLYLSASLGSNADPLEVPVHWRVTRADAKAKLPVYEANSARATLQVPSGRYDVEARLGLVAARARVDIDARAANEVNLPLNAGTIEIAAQAPRSRTSADVTVIISKPQGSSGPATGRAGDALLVTRTIPSEIALQPGPYVVTVAHGLFRVDRPVIVTAGSRGKLPVALPTGELELQAVATSGGPILDNAVFQIFEDDPDVPSGRREVARSASRSPSFTLAAGTYHVVVRQGTAEGRERVTVRPGEIARHTLVTSASQVALQTTIAGKPPASSDSVVYLVQPMEGGSRATTRATGLSATLDLAPGRYRIQSRLGGLNALAEQEIELQPGIRNQLTLDHRAGVVRLALVEPAGVSAVGDVFWQIRDHAGRIVWITGEAQPLGILQAGRYTVHAETRDRQVEHVIEVAAGDNRTIEIPAQ